ncbi:MAG TPA: hypothetical protein VLJ37_06605 [bacterium]|nr:hypothetical protein [bacterium]
MKKGLLLLAIVLFLGGGVCVAYALDRFSSAADYRRMVDRSMASMQDTNDMKALEDIKFRMDLDLDMLSNAKQSGMMGAGGAIVLLAGSVVLFLKSRRPKTA